MSIASEISRINQNVANAYTACSNKGATLPQAQNSANLATTISNIPSSSSAETLVTFSAVNSDASTFLSQTAYNTSDYTYSNIPSHFTVSRPDRPASSSLTLPSGTAAITFIDEDGSGYTTAASAGAYVVENLIPGKDYYYVATNSGGSILKSGVYKASGTLRMIDAGGNTFNIRDIGGWSCDGGTLHYGKIIRGCELNSDNYNVSLTDVQKAFFIDFLGIRDEIDLRGNSEVDGDDEIYGTADDITETALDDRVDYIRYPIAAYAAGINLASVIQTGYYAALIKRIVADVQTGKPCYIHCMAGADRTGTICALIEAICGVSQSDIDRDYELTSFASGNTRLRTSENWTGLITRINSFTGSTFRDKVVNYALQAGVTIEEINALRNALIDGTPSVLTSSYSDYTVTRTISNASSSNIDNAKAYQPYETIITPDLGNILISVAVTMGGSDISSDAVKTIVRGGVDISADNHSAIININRVTGNLAITAQATSSARIPSAYQEVEYIQSSGTQTIQIAFDSTYVGAYLETQIMRIGSGTRGLMGSASKNSATINAGAGSYFGWDTSGKYEMGGSAVSNIVSSTSSFDSVKFEWTARGSGKLTVNNSVAASRSGNVSLGFWNVFGGSNYPVSCKMKEVKVYNVSGGGSMTAHLVPCYRKSDSVVGMYDIVRGSFLTNIGTGTFTKGPDV